MKNIIKLIKVGANELYHVIKTNDKKTKQKLLFEKVCREKQKRSRKKSSVLVAASIGRNAVVAVRHHSSKFILGSSGLATLELLFQMNNQ